MVDSKVCLLGYKQVAHLVENLADLMAVQWDHRGVAQMADSMAANWVVQLAVSMAVQTACWSVSRKGSALADC